MIIQGMHEDKILEELIYDRKLIAKEAKKIARKFIACQKREGRVGIDVNHEFHHNFKTFLNNDKQLKKLGETEIMKICYCAHVSFNKSFYDKDVIEHFREENLDDMFYGFENILMP